MAHRTGLPANVIAPVGSKHIAKAYQQYFPYKGENITTYGRKGIQMKDIIHNKKLYISSYTSIMWNTKDANIPISQNI